MTEEQAADVRAIVVETLSEQQRIRHDDIDAVVFKAVATTPTSFGIDEEDRKELRADLQHLRRWRRSVEQAQSYTFKAVITVMHSANNFIRAGYRLFSPRNPWAWPNTLYWRKDVK